MRVGADIESLCGKCGDVWHVVVAIANGRIAKVQCKQCNAYHRYRPPTPEKVRSSTARSTTAPRTTKRAAKSVSVVEADPAKPPRPYRFSDTYAPGEPIDHAKFGRGVVQSVIGAGKIAVLFANLGSEKILIHARSR